MAVYSSNAVLENEASVAGYATDTSQPDRLTKSVGKVLTARIQSQDCMNLLQTTSAYGLGTVSGSVLLLTLPANNDPNGNLSAAYL